MSARDLWLEAYLASTPDPKCPACGGAVNPEGICTGCLRHIVVGLAAIKAPPPPVAWTLALAGLVLIMGIGLMAALLLVLRPDRMRQFGLTTSMLALALVGGAALGGALPLVRYRKAICGWERMWRVGLAVALLAALLLEGAVMSTFDT
jgi:hypothetical protein